MGYCHSQGQAEAHRGANGVRHILKSDVPKALGAPGYTVHGLRRTVASQMDELGIPESTIALCLNHSDGNRKSVTRGYIKPSAEVQRARELAKLALKRDAFDRWAERLREIVG